MQNTFSRISYKFQEPRLFEWLTALDNVKAVMPPCEDSDAEAKALLLRVGLFDSQDQYPTELSGGLQQRVALARALAHGGDLLLLDEPLSAVDSETKNALIAVVAEYAKDHAVLLVTHDPDEVAALGASLIVL